MPILSPEAEILDRLSAPPRAGTGLPGDPIGADKAAASQFNPRIAEKIVAASGGSALVEQYRKICATLYHAQLAHNTRVVMVASAVPGEGKTLTATNLALTFSESYRRRVLLIDADLRRPSVHDVFQIPNVYGLRDALQEGGVAARPLEISPTLSILTAGRPDPDPMSGLTSDRMRELVRRASDDYEWVIIDTPPVTLMPDAKLLAEMADVALLVIHAGSTPHRLVQRAVEALGRNRILGVVLNRVELRTLAGGYGYNYYGSYASYGPPPAR
jgi:capsular exopolysaccharide synthesis family protein